MNKSYVLNALLAIFSALAAAPATAQTTDYPNRPVRIIVPQTAGGAVDIVARAIAQKLSESWGQQVIIDNRPGANGIIGMEAVAKAKPDGYTLGAPFTSVLAINPFVYKTLPYDAFRDFAPVMQSVANVIVLVVHPSLPVRSVKDLVALGKSRPGDLVYGSFGVGNLTHLAGELLRMETKMKMVHVPYKGETPAVTDLIGGQYVLLFSTSAGVFAHIKEGRLRLLATGGEKSAAAYPDAPTMAEAGFPGAGVTGWSGLAMPAGTPPEIVQKFSREAARHVKSAEMSERLTALGAEPVGSSPEEFTAFIKSEATKWSRVIREAGISLSP
ncbi:MAG: tripartite tricarboxylate transporter substrate binding protein [Proteobacteria bacterium]|nr:tripartite tricarboxylate transporter substrate binding protein [Pseudomonadota bacterium]